MKQLIFPSLLICIIAACNPKTTEITNVVIEENTVDTVAQVNEGRAIYMKKCTKCHEAKIVKDYSRERWNEVLPEMIKRARLTDEEAQKVSQYVYWELEN